MVGFKKKAIDEAGHPIGLLAGDGIEVAVVALVKAKGNVERKHVENGIVRDARGMGNNIGYLGARA